ncbi:MAG TPA: NADPH:quinone oxidoreductase family protein [Actinomycetota bacterium]|nr:NADPH:quinone oxidoreductase family protein [Actinomycetota bacterium]
MRRVVCHEIGSLDAVTIEESEPLTAGPGQVLVDVRAAGMTFVDALMIRGGYQIKPPVPYTPGTEVAGVVADIGDGVDGISAGDRVIASVGLGGFAEQAIAGASAVFPLPDTIGFEEGASLVQSYATAWFALTRRTTVAPDEWVLVLGAGGGTGLAAVDVARSLGARVIGVASSADKRAAAEALGAEATIDSSEDIKVRAREISGGGVDIVYDSVGGDLAEPALRALKLMGRYVVIGFAAGEIPRIPLNQVLLNNRTVVGVEWGGWVMRNPDENRALVAEVIDAVSDGRLRPIAPSVVPLDRVTDALRDFEQRRVTGKVVLVP